jgi:hypothetical protein
MTWVRVKDSTGHEVTMSKARAQSLGLEVLDKPATDALGRPLPPKTSTDKAGRPAPKTKESTR